MGIDRFYLGGQRELVADNPQPDRAAGLQDHVQENLIVLGRLRHHLGRRWCGAVLLPKPAYAPDVGLDAKLVKKPGYDPAVSEAIFEQPALQRSELARRKAV